VKARMMMMMMTTMTIMTMMDDDDDDDNVASYIYWMICKHMWLQVADKYYEHFPERVINVCGTTLMWIIPVIID
jgi:hypothetical protein